MDEIALVEAVRDDPPRGFAALYRRYGDRIHDYCLAVLRHREDAADAAQDTFLIAYQRIGQLRDPARLTAWLYAIARSRCLRRVAERKRTYPADDLDPPAPPPVSSDVEQDELRRLVWDAAAGLAAEDRAVLDLHLRQGLSGAELAGALGVPAAKANLMLHRMKQRLRRTVGVLLVVRTGGRDCADLAAITRGGDLTPLLRKRLARHVERCVTCRDRQDRLAPELLYASVPLAAAPVAIGDRLAWLADPAVPDAAAASAQLRWRADGFPQPSTPNLAAPVGAGVAAVGLVLAVLVGVALFGGGAGVPAGAPAAPAAWTPRPAVPATVSPSPDPGSPAAPPATGTPAPASVPPPSSSAASPSPSAAAVEPPALSPLRLGNCGITVTAEVDLVGTTDPDPSADLMLSWDAGPGSPVPMQPVGGGTTYRAVVERQGAALGYVTFTAAGTVTDSAGNAAQRTASASCTQIVD